MKRKRVFYFILICIIILLGLASRTISKVPLYIGDAMWALMIFFIIRFLIVNARIGLIGFVSLFICYCVECSQLYQAEWVNSIRNTIIGRLVLGQGFLWSDILAYTVGIIIGILFEMVIMKRMPGFSAANKSNAA